MVWYIMILIAYGALVPLSGILIHNRKSFLAANSSFSGVG